MAALDESRQHRPRLGTRSPAGHRNTLSPGMPNHSHGRSPGCLRVQWGHSELVPTPMRDVRPPPGMRAGVAQSAYHQGELRRRSYGEADDPDRRASRRHPGATRTQRAGGTPLPITQPAAPAESRRATQESTTNFDFFNREASLLDYSERLLALAEELTERLRRAGVATLEPTPGISARSDRTRPSHARSWFPG